MAKLTGQTIAESYEQLLALPDGGLNGTTLVSITDGDSDVVAALQIATDKIQVNGNATITTADNTDTLLLISTNAEAAVAPNLNMYRNSASPAASDQLGQIQFVGRNNNSQDVDYALIGSQIVDATDGTEDGRVFINAMVNGTLQSRLDMRATETIINNESIDLDFRIESDANEHAFFLEGSTGNVGVGTASNNNSALLGIAGNINIGNGQSSSLAFFENSGTNMYIEGNSSNLNIGSVGNTQFTRFPAGGGLQVFGGNVGIGTIPASDSILHLASTTHGADLVQKWSAENDGGNAKNFYMVQDPDAHIFKIYSGVDPSFAIDGATGKVGIGTASPSVALHVKGDGHRVQVSSADYDLVKIGAFGDAGGTLDVGFINLLEDGNERIKLLADGSSYFTNSLGIGTAAPNEGKLVVQDGTKAELVIKTSATATDTEAALMFKISTDTVDQRKKGGIIYKDVGDNGIGDMFFVLDSATDNGSATVADNAVMTLKNSGQVLIGGTTDTAFTPSFSVQGTQPSLSAYKDADAFINMLVDEDHAYIFYDHAKDLRIGHATNVGGTSLTYNMILDANSRISLSNNDTSDDNTVFGFSAFNVGTDNASHRNTAIGDLAMGTGTVASALNNVAIGASALTDLTSGDSNIAIGVASATNITTGIRNIAIGTEANATATTASDIISIGANSAYAVLANNTASDGTIAIGTNALVALTSGAGNTAVGYSALLTNEDGDFNTAIGYEALNFFEAASDGQGGNTMLGYQAGKFVSTGTENTFIGMKAGLGITGTRLTGAYNVAVGGSVGIALQGGAHSNTFVGYYAGNTTTTGTGNTIIGYNCEAEDATAVNQTVIGNGANGQADNSVTLGSDSVTAVYMASDSGAKIYAGNAQFMSPDNTGHLIVDLWADQGEANADKWRIEIEDGADFTIESFTSGSWVEKLAIANDGTFTGSSSNDISDERLKENIKNITGGLDAINKLQGRTFNWKKSADMNTRTNYGLIAQEVEKVIPELIYEKGGIRELTPEVLYSEKDTIPSNKKIGDVKEKATYYKSLNTSGLVPVLIEAVKELSAKVTELESKLK